MTLEAIPDDIDRLSPALRPAGRPVMFQDWHHLLFVHWEVPAAPLQELLPPGLTLDTFEGRAFVGLIPFTMRKVRPRNLPSVPWLSYFHETNVRTYVRHEGREPGVWFFSLDAVNPIAVILARAWFGLAYHRARMCLAIDGPGEFGPALTYVSERLTNGPRPARSEIRARVTGPVMPAAPGSLEAFLIERYVLYTTRQGRLFRGRVHHAPYPLQTAEVDTLDETLLTAAGIASPDDSPLIHYAASVRTEVFGLTRV